MGQKISKADISGPIIAAFPQDPANNPKLQVPDAVKIVREKYSEAVIKQYGRPIVVLTCPDLPGGTKFHDVKKHISAPIKIEKTFRGRACKDPRVFKSFDIPDDKSLKETQALLIKKESSTTRPKEIHVQPFVYEIALDRFLDVILTGGDDWLNYNENCMK